MNSPKREEIAKQVDAEYVAWCLSSVDPPIRPIDFFRDALISREMRVRELEESLQTIADVAPGNGDVCELIARRARLALNSKGEKG